MRSDATTMHSHATTTLSHATTMHSHATTTLGHATTMRGDAMPRWRRDHRSAHHARYFDSQSAFQYGAVGDHRLGGSVPRARRNASGKARLPCWAA